MKICFIGDAGSIHMQRWVNYFAKRGHEIHLISKRAGGGYIKGVELHLLVQIMPHVWTVSRYVSGMLWIVQIRRLVRKIKPDVLDAHFITINGYLGVISAFHPLILSAWGSDILIHPKKNPLYRVLTKCALIKADIVICDSETVKKGLLELDTNPVKIKKIYWGVNTEQFSPQRKDEALRKRLSIAEEPTIICIRTFRPVYNVEMLIRAIPLVLKQVSSAKFIIAGDGEQRDYLYNLAKSLGVSDHVKFVGWIAHDELPMYLASSDIYVSTSLSDSTSLSLQEAMSCELVPVVTDLPANREWVKDDKNGFIVPINNVQTLADKVVYLIRNTEVRRKLGKASRRIIMDKAEYGKEMERMESIYKGLVKR